MSIPRSRSKTDPLICEPSPYSDWKPADNGPNVIGAAYYGYCPDIREDGAKVGQVEIVRYIQARNPFKSGEWVDLFGRGVRVTWWTYIPHAKPPRVARDVAADDAGDVGERTPLTCARCKQSLVLPPRGITREGAEDMVRAFVDQHQEGHVPPDDGYAGLMWRAINSLPLWLQTKGDQK